jgi:hypothetical protein
MKKAPETVKSGVLLVQLFTAVLGPIEAAPLAYSVVSFLPTQTSSTRLVVLKKRKAPWISPGALLG